ncbi:MAG: hypothetical protein ABSE43_07070 [Steroidobacteraceae bacterium]|jgi:hypothetical protein
MNTPPPHKEPVDEMTEVYRRASAEDPSRPSSQVREAVLAQARLAAGLQPGAGTLRASNTREASVNENYWHWKAVAGIATAGLIGLLSWQMLRTAPPAEAPHDVTRSAGDMDSFATPGATKIGSERNLGSIGESVPKAVEPPRPAARQQARLKSSRVQSNAYEAPSPSSAPAGISAGVPQGARPEVGVLPPSAAPPASFNGEMAKLSNALDRSAPAIASPAPSATGGAGTSMWNDKALVAVRSAYPELFAADAAPSMSRVIIVLNSDGSIFKSFKESLTDDGVVTAAEQIRKMLGVKSEDLRTSGVFAVPVQSTDQHNMLIVVFGVLR